MKSLLVCILWLCSASMLWGNDKQQHLENLLNSPELFGATTSVVIEPARTKGSSDARFVHQPSTHMVPASVTKLVTTAAALEYLGPDFRFHTGLFLDGIIDVNGTLRGNIFIKGAGDPTLGDTLFNGQRDVLQTCIDSLQYLGITSIRGNIIVDDSYFGTTPLAKGWAWDDLQYFYGAPVSGFNYRANTVDVTVNCKPNALPSVELSPASSGLVYEVRSSGSDQKITISRELNSSIVIVTIPTEISTVIRETESISVPNGSEFFLSVFSEALSENAIQHDGALLTSVEWADEIVYEDYMPLFSLASPQLREIIKVVNTESHNLAADCLALTLVQEKTGVCDWDSISPVFRSVLSLPENSFDLFDGSGLSRMNHMSAETVVAVLQLMLQSEHSEAYVQSLPRPGSGTLKYRLRDIRGNLRAKTGSMNATSCLAGYAWDAQNPPQQGTVFCILMNNLTCPVSRARTIQDLMCLSLFR